MAHIVSIANSKGGVGKSTTAHTLANGLHKRGYKTLLIDLDQQANATFNCGIDTTGKASSLEFMQGEINAIITTDTIDVIPADNSLSLASKVLTELGKEYKLKEALKPIQANYDFIVIDTPPAMETLTINALTTSDDIIVPVQAEAFSLKGIAELKQVIETIQKYCNPSLTVAGILITRYNARATLNKDIKELLQGIAQTLKTTVFDTVISQCIAISESQAEQQSILDYSPTSKGAKQYNAFIDEYLKGVK